MRLFWRSLWMGCLIGSVWLHAESLGSGSIRALKENKLLLVSIESEACPYCKKMKREIFEEAKYRQEIEKQYVHLVFNNRDSSLPPDLRAPYVPANAILSPKDQSILDAYVGYIAPERFMKILEGVYKGAQ
ncbi:thioredoxin fold domain-containing protein [Wolinella succinogenes]|uniref:thioredoxin fold domain-containing protein n=1 Tax=Wolinella succinogenes TaxID=844 RepID=UPI00240941C4|nr:thioredoxin fold domain-containing protein [Wolinella succinogenes]